tara:strand:+ start:1008 stop:1532 length:525 start_codon:yes stop_codon:yes gene_type:complete
MANYSERLKNLDNKKLIDVVKNYRQYGYDENLRASAISILDARGITKEQLELTGNFDNKAYDYANQLYNSFSKNSKIAFILFLIILSTNIVIPILAVNSETLSILVLIANWVVLFGYFIFLIKSFLDQNRFYKTINQDYATEGALMYLFLGMPFYIIMYFYFKKQMKEKIREIK